MKKGRYLSKLLRSKKTIFTIKDIALLWDEAPSNKTRTRINYFAKKGELYPLRQGIYAKNKDYDKLELSNKIYSPSYISFETVLAKEGLIFQYYQPIFLASYLTRQIEIEDQTYSFRKLKDSILYEPKGVIYDGETSLASKERAFLDILYINKDYYFDNLEPLNWDIVFDTLKRYNNKRMEKVVNKIYKKI